MDRIRNPDKSTDEDLPFEKIKGGSFGDGKGSAISMACPHCRHIGTFTGGIGGVYNFVYIHKNGSKSAVHLWMGARVCPNTACLTPVLLIERGGRLLYSSPPTTLDFELANLPEKVASALQEAIRCHSTGCFRAAALLVRRTLEEVCLDQGAKGENLKKRIANLAGKITIPPALASAMDELRLLGNDAAHVEAKTYDEMGNQEVTVAIMLAKEIVKATYQLDNLLQQIRGLQRPGPAVSKP